LIRTLLAASHEDILRVRFAVALAATLALGAALSLAIKELLPSRPGIPPVAAIAATSLLLLAAQTLVLVNFGLVARNTRPFAVFLAWLKTVLLTGAALIGIYLSGVGSDSPRMPWIAWGYCAGFTGLLATFWALLSLAIGRRVLALQIVLVFAVLANSALFWTRSPITAFSSNESTWSAQLPDATLKLSPPLALAGAWHQEGGADGAREGSRFDIIRAPLSYDVWIGSYHTPPYPAVLPRSGDHERPFNPGLLLALLIWTIPLLMLTEVLNAKMNRTRS